MIIYVLILIILFSILLIAFTYIYNNFQNLIIRINEAEININSALNKKFDLLNRTINIAKANAEINKEIFENIVKLRSRKIDDFELDKELNIAEDEFCLIRNEYEILEKADGFIKICSSLSDVREQLIAAKLYYNDCVIHYNKLIRYFPSNLLAIIFKYKERRFHENIDLFLDSK